MPYLGLGVHVLVALYFAVHAVRTGQGLYWLFVLFSFPLLGSIVYLVAIYLPESSMQHKAKKMAASAVQVLDPSRALRQARDAFEFTPTAQNRMRLAEALLENGQVSESVDCYEQCLSGQFASDPEIRLGAARANFAAGQFSKAVEHLLSIRQLNTDYRAEQVSVLLAKALAGDGRGMEAQAEFEFAMSRFGGFEVKAEYLIWAFAAQNQAVIERLLGDVQQTISRWNRYTKNLNRPLLQKLDAAHKQYAR
jgi:hypothetical protein